MFAGMAFQTIALGRGHPRNDPTGRTVLDVHLHLNCPEGPFSIGERCGNAPDVGVQVTLEELADRHFEHLLACGCEWLVPLATEERLRRRKFSPQEILERRPVSQAPERKAEPAKRARPGGLEAMPGIREALARRDYEALEGLRDVLNDDVVRALAAEWSPSLPWAAKDAYAALLQDQLAPCVHALFRDALKSPTAETRAYALCVLTGDFGKFTELMSDGGVDAAKVDAAIARAGLR